ncbi:16S rRNA (cytosine(1402)-N(4))-methyltransferase RsmH [Salinibacillus xinjiangensis]|uniref:Ribosomal RNA small subunit methyltransferase H n=1 Tax=Salinibacillus xinjiangensis TaxID=1229268 RepID=A0A6G1X3P1_9BACI|nr:16S rRNA (cytosine(1402)-N(4))-methyltransferase RsmH [Salinibacillus xinjiangensis]MRG85500.1 16S rRNA (cytosine(1402)-N(4))-methyltransferase RsmH [Salinibacillus xinjiangensis]
MFEHYSVLKNEAVEGLHIKPEGTYVDCTLGGGGHSEMIVQALSTEGKLIAFDQDIEALQFARDRLADYEKQCLFVHANFQQLKEKLHEHGIHEVDGVLFDLGVSSPQLDQAVRGFSYHQDAPLDMRMNQSQALSAHEVVNNWAYGDLVKIFFRYGEEKFSKQIARKIEQKREQQKIETTAQLVEIIKDAIPAAARRKGGHPAKRIFQAIRIAVNNELGAFQDALHQAAEVTAVGGRISVITFHSLEDRICKKAMKKWSTPPPLPKNIPVIPESAQPPFKMITRKPIIPKENELEENRRSRSAKLRIVEKVKAWDKNFRFDEGSNV